MHLVIRERITGSNSPPNTSVSLEKWRPWINNKIGNLLSQLAENTTNQEVFAKYTKELLSALHTDIGERDPNNDGENEDTEDNNPDENEENNSSAESESDNDEDAGLDSSSDAHENDKEIQGETQDADADNEDGESEGEITPNPLSGDNIGKNNINYNYQVFSIIVGFDLCVLATSDHTIISYGTSVHIMYNIMMSKNSEISDITQNM